MRRMIGLYLAWTGVSSVAGDGITYGLSLIFNDKLSFNKCGTSQTEA
jgi:hypothetical protein